MDITFKDSKKQRKWTYTGLRRLLVFKEYITVMGWDEMTNENYSFRLDRNEFDSIELEKSEDEA